MPLDKGLLAKVQCPPGPLPGHPVQVHGLGSAPARRKTLSREFSSEQGIRFRLSWGSGIRQDSARLSHERPSLTQVGLVIQNWASSL